MGEWATQPAALHERASPSSLSSSPPSLPAPPYRPRTRADVAAGARKAQQQLARERAQAAQDGDDAVGVPEQRVQAVAQPLDESHQAQALRLGLRLGLHGRHGRPQLLVEI